MNTTENSKLEEYRPAKGSMITTVIAYALFVALIVMENLKIGGVLYAIVLIALIFAVIPAFIETERHASCIAEDAREARIRRYAKRYKAEN